MKTIKTFRGVRGFLSRIPDINCGGCGIAAYAMYLWLKANNKLIDTFRFVLLYEESCEGRYINNQNVLHKGKGNGKAPCHMCIFYDDKYMDSDTMININDYSFVQIVKDEWFITNCINNKPSWNDWFNRSNIQRIEERLNITMNINK